LRRRRWECLVEIEREREEEGRWGGAEKILDHDARDGVEQEVRTYSYRHNSALLISGLIQPLCSIFSKRTIAQLLTFETDTHTLYM
jgi:hypothetical protein